MSGKVRPRVKMRMKQLHYYKVNDNAYPQQAVKMGGKIGEREKVSHEGGGDEAHHT